MKKTISILATIVLVFSLFSSCNNNEKDKENANARSSGFLTAKINNVDITSTTAVMALETKVSGVKFYTIVGEDKKNEAAFRLYYKTEVDGATDDVNKAAQAHGLEYREKGYLADKKTLNFKITKETDTAIEGTFSFEAKEMGGNSTITVSNGKFKAIKR